MIGDVFAIFSDELSVEDISSIILSYHEQELHFLSLRIDFLKSKMTPKMTYFLVIFKVKIGLFWGVILDFKKSILSHKKCNSYS